jgi:radical SAM protein with 4Fe4S-binding SPASM domain
MSADQWLEDGDCDKCRRIKYCNKPCKKHKIATRRMITNMVLEATGAKIIHDELRRLGTN